LIVTSGAGTIHGAIKGKSTTDVARAARGGKALTLPHACRSTPPGPGNHSETLSENLPRQALESLPIFNDSCPNFVSNVRLKIIHVFEGGSLGFALWRRKRLERSMRHDFSKTLRRLWRACLGGEGAYRPDLHYMRGPGPKWHAKYGSLAKANGTGGSSGRSHRAQADRA
jgi:hypothetical protein